MLEHIAAHLHLFGGLRLVFPSATLREGSLATKAAAVIKLLAIRPGHTAHRDEVGGTLWPDATERQGANNLYKAVHHLRGQLPDPEARDIVQIRRKVVTLADWVEIDLDQFFRECEAARVLKSRDAYDRALAHTTAPLLPCDIYEDWTRGVRENISRLDRQMHFEAAELCLLSDDTAGASDYLHAVLASDPTNEHAHRRMMEIFASRGDSASVARQYENYEQVLATELGLPPSEAVRNLYDRLAARPSI
jgi:DNA-binding SARP family transcriptional activator